MLRSESRLFAKSWRNSLGVISLFFLRFACLLLWREEMLVLSKFWHLFCRNYCFAMVEDAL
jgi:hypothetical protein